MNVSAMRTLAPVAALLAAVACGKKDKPSEGQPPTAASASASATALTYGTAAPSVAPTATAANDDAAPIEKVKPKGPVLITRKHEAGQRYSAHLEREATGGKLVIDGLATVTLAGPKSAEFALLVDNLTENGKLAVSGPVVFEVKASFDESPFSVDAEERGSRSASLYLTPIEHMIGTLCEPPREAHLPGDAWKAKDGNKTEWKLTGYDKQGSREYASFESVSKFTSGAGGSWSTKMRVATDDGYTGTCTADVILKFGKGLPDDKQSWLLRVKSLKSGPK
jgi:hypothetical protein